MYLETWQIIGGIIFISAITFYFTRKSSKKQLILYLENLDGVIKKIRQVIVNNKGNVSGPNILVPLINYIQIIWKDANLYTELHFLQKTKKTTK